MKNNSGLLLKDWIPFFASSKKRFVDGQLLLHECPIVACYSR
ncbi:MULTISPECIES: hypothetical protein [Sphingobacterium]|uniref:Uncharacterized protein n=1 Tax=Sphingobacterium zeae TaxID=1776859 RepID=A0ABU0U225_9SPHI|nr:MULTISPECIES: hypothetical protein [Sphingobacterium]MDQ1149010.1 hypothetical protein [Sphingobacterium zeae]